MCSIRFSAVSPHISLKFPNSHHCWNYYYWYCPHIADIWNLAFRNLLSSWPRLSAKYLPYNTGSSAQLSPTFWNLSDSWPESKHILKINTYWWIDLLSSLIVKTVVLYHTLSFTFLGQIMLWKNIQTYMCTHIHTHFCVNK